MNKLGPLFAVLSLAGSAFGTGFGLYEASSPTYALGGTVVGRAFDASANFFNPATLTDLTNVTVTVGFMTEHPRAEIKTNGRSSEKMNPGVFFLPHFHLAVPLPWDFSFGLGMMPEYGLGSQYERNWALSNNSRETTVTSFTVNPNLAWKCGDFSIGAGLRFLYFDFEQYSHPVVVAPGDAAYPLLGEQRFQNRLKGDNGMEDFGWQIGAKYDILDNLSVGAVYKSRTLVHVKGKTSNRADSVYLDERAAAASGPARTELDLPDSITAGFNWDITPAVHLGGSAAWTHWSTVDVLDFNLNGNHKNINLLWNDTWRFGIGPSWDFAENWTALCSYVYETDCCGRQLSTMLPAAERHMLSWGLVWRAWHGIELGLTYGMILMDGRETHSVGPDNRTVSTYEAHHGISHATGLTLTWRF